MGSQGQIESTSSVQKPRLRGRLHLWGFIVSIFAGIEILLRAANDHDMVIVGIYAFSISAMLGASAAFHIPQWSTKARRRMRRLDHSTIFLAVAGTYTPVAAIGLTGSIRDVVLWVVWGGAALGVAQQMIWLDAPKWVSAVVYLALGWAAVWVLPDLYRSSGPWAMALIVAGGILYSIGAAAYATKRPNPWPKTFGYHEVFHSFVLAAVICHYVAISYFIMNTKLR